MSKEDKIDELMAAALKFERAFYKIAYGRGLKLHDAQDVVQETYLKIISNPDEILSDSASYFFAIVKSVSNEFIRKKRRFFRTVERGDEPFVEDYTDYKGDRKDFLKGARNLIGKDEFSILERLVSKCSDDADFSGLIIDGQDFREISKSLGSFASKYVRNDIFPPKKIMRISFNPFKINFSSRVFNGNPLNFFLKNYKYYEGLSRTELYEFDQTLYTRLRNAGQLALAIPNKRKNRVFIEPEKLKKILGSYSTFNANARAAAKSMGYAPNTILRYWKKNGLGTRSVGRKHSEEEHRKILQSYEVYGGIVSHAARELGYSRVLVSKIWKEGGLEVDNSRGLKCLKKIIGAHHISEKDAGRIVSLYEKCGGVIGKASKISGHCEATIKRYWENAGLSISQMTLGREDVEAIVSAYKDHEGSIGCAAKALGRNWVTVRKYWRQAGLI